MGIVIRDNLIGCVKRSKCLTFKIKKHSLLTSVFLFSHLALVSNAYATPEGGVVVGGSGTINQSNLTTTVNQASQNMAIDWQSYNVQQNERVQYIQPNTSSISLNRIVGNNASAIHGRIDANGQVFLVNPNGIFFSPTSVINVGGIMASGLDIKPSDFMNGNYIFNEVVGTDGFVFNSGIINAATGGNVTLLGKQVKNDGVIVAKLGAVNMAAGKQAVVTFDNAGLLGVKVTKEVLQNELGIDPAVLNSGTINAEGGRILLTASVSQDIFSRAVNTGGMTDATSAVVNADGTFTLGGGADVVNAGTLDVSVKDTMTTAGNIVVIGENVTNSGVVKADNEFGAAGNIELHANDTTLLTQDSMVSAQATNNGVGGNVKILGNKVGLIDNAQVNASGANGGGTILIGGDKTGSNKQIRSAEFIFLDENTHVHADALSNGDGGKLITFASDTARIYGNLTARGGVNSGNGGFIETSGLKGFEITNGPDATAANGVGGEWLIDPFNITIRSSGATNTGIDITNVIVNDEKIFDTLLTGAILGVDLITTQLNNGVDVTVTTSESSNAIAAGTELGNITVAADILFTDFNSSATLTLEAANNITLDGGVKIRADQNSSGQQTPRKTLNLILTAGNDISLTNNVINTNGGDFTATGVTFNMTGGEINTISNNYDFNNNNNNTSNRGGDVGIFMSGSTTVPSSISINRSALIDDGKIITDGGAVKLLAANPTVGAGTISTTSEIDTTILAATNNRNAADSNIGSVALSADGVITIGGQINTDIQDVIINEDVTYNSNVVVVAGGAVDINNSITTNGGSFDVVKSARFNSSTAGEIDVTNSSGDVSILSGGTINIGSDIITDDGDINLNSTGAGVAGIITVASTAQLTTNNGGNINIGLPEVGFSTTRSSGFTLDGSIDTSSGSSGQINIASTGAVNVNGSINTQGGNVTVLNSNAFANTGAINTAIGGNNGRDGDVSISSISAININGAITTDQGFFSAISTGTYSSNAAGDIDTTESGSGGSSRGTVTISAVGLINFAGEITTNSGNVSLNSTAAGTASNITISDTINTGSAGTLTVLNNGVINATAAPLVIGGLAKFGQTGTNAIILNNDSNNFSTIELTNTAGDIVIHDTNNILLAASNIGTGALTVNAGQGGGTGGISHSGAITQATGAGNVTLNAGDGDISLANSGNNFVGNIALTAGVVSGAARSASISNQNNIVLADTFVTGDLTAQADAGAISQTAGLGLDVAGTTTLIQDGGQSVSLGNVNNKLTGISLLTNGSTGNLIDATIQNSSAIDLQQMRLGGNLSVTAIGAITNSGGDINVSGNTTLSAGAANNINLTTGAHDFTNLVIATANNVTIDDVNSINIGDAVGTVSSVSGDLDLTALDGDITQTAVLNMTAGSTSTFNASGGIASGNVILNEHQTAKTLIQNNFDNIVLNSTGSSFVADVDAINLGGTASSVGGNLTINANGTISQTAQLTMNAGSVANLTSVTGNINFGAESNDFDIVNLFSSGAVTLNDTASNGIRLDSVNITGAGSLNVTANGAISDVASEIIVAGTTTLNSGSAAINLNTIAHDFFQFNVSNAGSLIVEDRNALMLGTVNVSGPSAMLDVTTAGILNQTSNTSAITNTGNTVINSGANAITLNNGNNDFGGTVSLNNTAGDVEIADANAIQFTSSTLGAGIFTVDAGLAGGAGGISQTGGGITQVSVAGVAGDVTLNARDGDIELGVEPNDFIGDVTLSTAGTNRSATIGDINNIQLAEANVTGDLNVKAGTNSNITQLASGLGLTVGGTSTFDVDAGNSITLGNTNNDFTGLSFLANGSLVGQLDDVTVANSTGLDLQSLNLSGDLNVTAVGDITNLVGSIQVAGDTVLTANLSGVAGETNNITLTGAENEFNNVVIINAGSVTLTEADTINNGLNIGDTDGAISSISGNLTVTTNGNFTQTAALNMSAGSLATFNSGGSINLRSHRDNNSIINNDFSNIVLNASGNVDVSDINGVNLGDAIGQPLAVSSIGGNLTVNANTIVGNAGNITQTADLNMSAGTTANFSADNGQILLESASNNFNILELSSNNIVRINDVDGLILGNTSANELTINAAASITENGSSTINVSGLTTLNTSATADINISTGNHTFNDVVFTGNNVAISTNSGINIGDSTNSALTTSTANGGLTLIAGGNITDIGSALVDVSNAGSTTTLSAGGDIALANTDFAGGVNANAGNRISINDATGLTLGTVTATNEINLTSGSNINGGTLTSARVNLTAETGINVTTQTGLLNANNTAGAITVNNTGNVTIESLKTVGDITLNNDANISMQPGSVDADYDTGVIAMTTTTGSFLGLGAPDDSNPDITGFSGTFIGRLGSFGTAIRPLVISIKDEILINTRQSISPRYVPTPPRIVNDLSDITFDFIDASNAVSGEQLITLEELEDIDPAIFSDVRNYTYGQIAIRLPRDQLFEDELKEVDKK